MTGTIYLANKYRDKIREVQTSLNTNDHKKILEQVKQVVGFKRTNISTVRYWAVPLGEKLYTIGNRRNYLESIAVHGQIYKIGQEGNYSGGAVWRTKDEAWKHIYDKGLMFHYSVWIVEETLWETETKPSTEGYNFLLIDRLILGEAE